MSPRPLLARLGRASVAPSVAVAVAVVLLLVSFALGLYNERAARAETVRQGQVQAQILASSLAAPLAFDDQAETHAYVTALGAHPAVDAVGAYDTAGRLVASFRRAGSPPLPAAPASAQRIAEGRLEISRTVREGGLTLGRVYLRMTVEPIARRAARYVAIGSILVLASLLIAVLGSAQASLRLANRKLRDEIAERERAEAALQQAQKMEAMGQLTGGVAHDFNNLLMVISSGLELMDRTDDPARRERLRQGVRQAVERGANLTQQLLAFARKAPLKTELIDPVAELQGMQQVLDRSLREDIDVQVIAEAPVWQVEIDPSQFELAVLNIAINARDAMPRGGSITIWIANELEEERVRVAIRDTGTGIAPEDLPRIFEPFFTTKPVGQGTGLGLSQVYGFARASGGEVQVESAPGQGTTVSLLLPRSHKTPPAPAPVAPATAAEPGRRRVLVVEDDDRIAELVCEMLHHLGCDTLREADAASGLQTAKAEADLDLVITDMVMPGEMSGLDLAHRLRAERIDLPVILTTGYSASAARAAAEGLPMLAKPYSLADLSEALDRALGARPAQSPADA